MIRKDLISGEDMNFEILSCADDNFDRRDITASLKSLFKIENSENMSIYGFFVVMIDILTDIFIDESSMLIKRCWIFLWYQLLRWGYFGKHSFNITCLVFGLHIIWEILFHMFLMSDLYLLHSLQQAILGFTYSPFQYLAFDCKILFFCVAIAWRWQIQGS